MSRQTMRRVLLIGGSGFLGTNLGLAFAAAGFDVVSADPGPPRQRHGPDAAAPIRSVTARLEDSAQLEAILSERPFDVVVHLASSLLPASGPDDLLRAVDRDLASTIRLVDALKRGGCARIVFFSSGGAMYGGVSPRPHREEDPPMPLTGYGWLKHVTEEYLRLQSRTGGPSHLIVRPSNPYGPHQDVSGRQGLVSVVLGRILRGEPLEVWGDGSVVRDYVYVDDLCAAVVGLVNAGAWNQTFNVGSGVGASVNEVIALAREITGRPLDVRYLPGRSVDVPHAVLDIDRLGRLVPFHPRPLAEGMRALWRHLLLDAGAA